MAQPLNCYCLKKKDHPFQSNTKCNQYNHLPADYIWWRTIFSTWCRCWGRCKIFNIDSNFHSIPAIPSTAQEVITPCLCQLNHIPAAASNVLYEALVIAVLIACFVDLQDIVGVLVKHKNWKKEKRKIHVFYLVLSNILRKHQHIPIIKLTQP